MTNFRKRCVISLACLAAAFSALFYPGAGWTAAPAAAGAQEASVLAADTRSQDWLTSGHDWRGTYFSPLKRINADTAGRVGFAWAYDLSTSRGQEATPVVIGGTMYVATNWGRVVALDAASGRAIWTYDPEVDGQWGRYACCDIVNRGVAVWDGVVYVGSTDNYLHAIDARTGKRLWKADTLDADARKHHTPYTTSGAPQVAGHVVVIGNGGADFGVRGFVRAFDLKTGAQRWTFWIVPHDPALGPQEKPYLDAALKTWDARSDWSRGGGGTAWDGMAYDPKLDLLYVGTGNSSPYNYLRRSRGKGDNLYLASIVAIDPKTGDLRWHYQTVPGERWDYTATQKMILADLGIGGQRRQVLMQAPKNGFFYVLDRATGELISATPYTYENWAKGIDPNTKAAIVNLAAADYEDHPKLIYPSQAGGHNWQPMSFDPSTGLVYIPVIDAPMVYINTAHTRAGETEGTFEVMGVPPESYDPAALASLAGSLPPMTQLTPVAGGPKLPSSRGFIRAWDPVRARMVWEQPTQSFWDGGVVSTAGNLVMSGDIAGRLNLRRADRGTLIKSIATGTSIMAAPMTYEIDGVQYIAVVAGLGGGGGGQFPPDSAAYSFGNEGRILVFKLDGGATPMPARLAADRWDAPPRGRPSTATNVMAGEVLFNRYCMRCHGFGRGELPDLRRAPNDIVDRIPNIVLGGELSALGMGNFSDVLTAATVSQIQDYLSGERIKLYTEETKSAHLRVK